MSKDLEINCPKCGEVIKLDETLAGPAIAKIRAEASQSIKEALDAAEAKAATVATQEAAVAARERELVTKEASVETLVNKAMAAERKKIAAEELENAKNELAPELQEERRKASDLRHKLEAAEANELKLRKEKDAIDDRAKGLDLEVARKVDEQRKAIQEQAGRDADDAYKLEIAEKDKKLSDTLLKLEEAQRKLTQGSQQLQGDVLEVDFESTLRRIFPQDTIEPVKTGVRGGDILQRVSGKTGRPVATMFWETKRAQSWGRDWIAKAKQDAAEAKAEVAIIVSVVLPDGIEHFADQDGVWCCGIEHALALGAALRQGVIATADARQGALGRQTKKEMLYDYMTGPEFRAVVEGIALPFRELSDELSAEKRATLARWKRQEKRIDRVLTSVASLQGDLQGIAGAEMPQIAGFELETGVHEIAASNDDE